MMKIKRLNFIKKDDYYEARTALVIYCIDYVNMLCIMHNDGVAFSYHKTFEEAKEHAHKDFEQRIMAYIE